jgi:hypothetical protein
MKEAFNPYLYKITIFTLILLVITIILTRVSVSQVILPVLPLIVVFFFIVNVGVHYLIVRITLKKIRQFYNYFMISTLARLLLYLAVILIYSFSVKEGKAAFTVSFFVIYIFYSGFEVITLSSDIKRMNQKNS